MHEINLYQTHLTEGQWSYINKEFLENDRRKRKYSLQSVFEAILYLLVSGCQWRRLPHDYPAWKSVYYYYHKWRQEVVSSISLRNLVRKIRRKRGQASSPSVGAMDAQSVKWGSRQRDNGYDGNKKVKGIKRNIITDRNGFILARKVCNAGIHDSKMAHELCGLADDVWEDLRKVLSDREGIGETWTKTLKKTSASSLRYPIPPMELRDSCQSRSDGWLRGLSHGLILAADSPGTMRY